MKEYATVQWTGMENLCPDFELEGGTFAPAPALNLDCPEPPPGENMAGLNTLVRVEMPLFSAPEINSQRLVMLKYGDSVRVLQDNLSGDWAMVLMRGQTGYCNRNYLLKTTQDIPPGTKLYKIKEAVESKVDEIPEAELPILPLGLGHARRMTRQMEINRQYRLNEKGQLVHVHWDSLEMIIKENYPDHACHDLRTIANALLFFNNPENDKGKGIYVQKDGSLFEDFLHENGINYGDIIVKVGYEILLPPWGKITRLAREVHSGSITATLVRRIWPDGFGVFFECAATCAFIAAKGRVQIGCYFLRQGNNIFLQFRALGSVGVGKGVGTSIKLGRGTYGAGASVSADVEAMVDGFGLVEFNLPVQVGAVGTFIGRNFEQLLGRGNKRAAESFVNDFEADTTPFLTKAIGKLGLHVTGQGYVSAGMKKAGKNAGTTPQGHQANSTLNQRTALTENVIGTRLKDRLTALKQGGKEKDVHAIGGLLSQLVALSGSAEATAEVAVGFEYIDQNGAPPTIALFLEGKAVLSVQAILVRLGFGIGAGSRWKFIQAPDGKWYYAHQDLYLHSGELDYFSEGGFELSYQTSEQNRTLLEELRAISFIKRFHVPITPGQFGRHLRGTKRYASLMSSDALTKGGTIRATITLSVDLAHLNPKHPSLHRLLKLAQSRKMTAESLVQLVCCQIDDLKSPSAAVLDAILHAETITSCQLHAELGVGLSASSRLGAHGQLDMNGAGGLFFEKDLTERIRQMVEELVDGLAIGEGNWQVMLEGLL